jgi:hypothetical protein
MNAIPFQKGFYGRSITRDYQGIIIFLSIRDNVFITTGEAEGNVIVHGDVTFLLLAQEKGDRMIRVMNAEHTLDIRRGHVLGAKLLSLEKAIELEGYRMAINLDNAGFVWDNVGEGCLGLHEHSRGFCWVACAGIEPAVKAGVGLKEKRSEIGSRNPF